MPLECPHFASITGNVACLGCPVGRYGTRGPELDSGCTDCSNFTDPAPCGEFPEAYSDKTAVLCPGFLPCPLAADPKSFALAPLPGSLDACVTAADASSVSYATSAVPVSYYYYLAAVAGGFLALNICL